MPPLRTIRKGASGNEAREELGEFTEWNRLGPTRQGVAPRTPVNHEGPLWADVLACEVEAARQRRSGAEPNLDDPGIGPPGQVEHEVHFGPASRPIEEGIGAFGRSGQQRLDNESFPARTYDRMTEQGIAIRDPEERMDESAVPEVEAR